MERVSEYDSAQFLCKVLGGGILEEGFQTRLAVEGESVVYDEIVARRAKHHHKARAERRNLRP